MKSQESTASSLLRLIDVLARDADACEAEVMRTGTGLAKRNFVRALFAWIEAISYLMRRYVLCELQKEPLTEDSIPTLLAASEKTYYVDGNGNVAESTLHTRTSNNLLFSLKAFGEVVGLPVTVDKGGRNWQNYSRALKIRDQVTHPKRPEDLELTSSEIEAVREAKGMISAYLRIFGSPELKSHITAKRQEAQDKNIDIRLVFTEEDLRRFGVK